MIEKLTDLAGKLGSTSKKYSPSRLFSVGISILLSRETIHIRALSELGQIGGEGGLSAVSLLAFFKKERVHYQKNLWIM